MRIALVQMKIYEKQPSRNLKKTLGFVRRARQKKANVIVFPEDFLAGPFRGDGGIADAGGRYRMFFQKLAKKNKIDIVAGSWVEKSRGSYYNTSYYINSKGKVLGKYRKINLWKSEKYVKPGKRVVVFDTRYGKAGLAICWGLINPILFRKMAKKRARIIYCPSYWWKNYGRDGFEIEKNNVNALCHTRSMENNIIVVYVNAAGNRTKKYPLIGHSQVVVPMKGAIAKIKDNKEKMLIVDLDTDVIKRADGVYKIGQMLRKNR